MNYSLKKHSNSDHILSWWLPALTCQVNHTKTSENCRKRHVQYVIYALKICKEISYFLQVAFEPFSKTSIVLGPFLASLTACTFWLWTADWKISTVTTQHSWPKHLHQRSHSFPRKEVTCSWCNSTTLHDYNKVAYQSIYLLIQSAVTE